MDSNPVVDILIPIICIFLIVFGLLILVLIVWKLNGCKCFSLSSNSQKTCSTLNNEESQCSNYGTCEEKSSNYSINSETRLRRDSISNESLSTTWTQKFLQKIQNFKNINLKNNNKESDSINLRSLSRMSSFSSYTSINSLSTILSNENLPQHNKMQNIILNYSLYLNPLNKSLRIDLVSLENVKLPISLVQSNLDLNVYVRIELLEPNCEKNLNNLKKICAKTRLIKNRTNPIYDETFEFNNLNELFNCLLNESQNDSGCFRLVFNVCNSNLFGRDQIIGLCVHSLKQDDLTDNNNKSLNVNKDTSYSVVDMEKHPVCSKIYSKKIDLVDSKSSEVNLGQLQMSLCYDNKTKTIHIHILKAFNIQLPKYFLNSDKNPNSYIKIYMIYRGQRVDKKQTKIKMESTNPIYDETFEFNILNLLQLSQPLENVSYEHETSETRNETLISQRISSRIQFIFLIMDWDKVEKSDVIGKIELNTQHHMQRLINHQTSKYDPSKAEQSTSILTSTQNWFDIFYHPNQPVLCTFQIKNY
ncbi:unnamed protein product [Brachionus calyciflorus]|uniref:C2 domain-containing protein n=1 Tax=Brachionus calyciflorus TaxID=104777 RepID=A0A813M3C0_9BILA|nr:unnamed protein product [Brachionus calyciflorus]